MDEREVPDVEEVLDDAWPAGPDAVGPGHHNVIRGIIEQLERRDPGRAAAQRDPYDPVHRLREIRHDPRLFRRRLVGMGGNVDAAPIRAVGPTVIRALNPRTVDDAAQGKTRATVDAEVAPCENFVARTPQDDVLAKEPGRDGSAAGKLFHPRHRVPIVHEDRIVDQRTPFPDSRCSRT